MTRENRPSRKGRLKGRAVDFGTSAGRQTYWSCLRKVKFASDRIAKKRVEESALHGVTLFTYRCPECKNWHLTRKKTGAKK